MNDTHFIFRQKWFVYASYIAILTLIFNLNVSLISNDSKLVLTQSKKTKTYLVVVNEKHHLKDEIHLAINGKLSTTGDCHATPLLGLLKKKKKTVQIVGTHWLKSKIKASYFVG